MSKNKAKKMAYENKTMTYGDLLNMLDNVDMDKPSPVNPNTPKQMVVDIMRSGFEDKNPNDVVNTTRTNQRGDLTLSGDGINMMNILRECA